MKYINWPLEINSMYKYVYTVLNYAKTCSEGQYVFPFQGPGSGSCHVDDMNSSIAQKILLCGESLNRLFS